MKVDEKKPPASLPNGLDQVVAQAQKGRVLLMSAREIASQLLQKLHLSATVTAAERLGENPGILLDLLAARGFRDLAPGSTKILLPNSKVQVIFQRSGDWKVAGFRIPEEVPDLAEGSPSYTPSSPCPRAREAFTIIGFFKKYHERMGLTEVRSELAFLMAAQTPHGLYCPSPLDLAYQLFQQPEFKGKQNFIDPACGPGSTVFIAALFFPQCAGSDLNQTLIQDAKGFIPPLKDLMPRDHKVGFGKQDFTKINYRKYDVVYLFLDKDYPLLEERILATAKPGTIVTCYGIPKLTKIPLAREFGGVQIHIV